MLRKSIILVATSLLFLTAISSIYGDEFDIVDFSDPYKYSWSDEELRLRERDELFLKTLLLDDYNQLKQSPVVNALKTSIAPGWGHFSVNSYTKGQVFLGLQLGLLSTSFYYREKGRVEYRKYEQATQIDEINKYYDDALTPFRQSNLLLGLFAVVWGYTIYDAVIETNEYNRLLWEDLIDSNRNISLMVTPTGITVRF